MQAGGRRFDPVCLHQTKAKEKRELSGVRDVGFTCIAQSLHLTLFRGSLFNKVEEVKRVIDSGESMAWVV